MLEIAFRTGEREQWQNLKSQGKTKPIQNKKPKRIGRSKKRGPKANVGKRLLRFEETAVGHYLYVYAPIEFYLLMEWRNALRVGRRGMRITYNQIETLSMCSDNPVFRSAGFRRALISFRRFGLRPKRKNIWTLTDAVYYAKYSRATHEMIKECTEG